MYHRKPIQTQFIRALAILATFAAAFNFTSAYAHDQAKPHTLGASGTSGWSGLPNVKLLKEHPVKGVEIYQYDNTAVDGRLPLLMVHGLDGENKSVFRWDHVCEFLKKDSAFNSKYKVLLARYNTHIPLADVTQDFQHALTGIHKAFGGKPVTMLALSMGGNLIQQAMVDPQTSAQVDRVITMGTPFHGSPLFASDWMRFSMAKHYRLPFMRLDNCLPYSIYFDRHRNLLTDLPWDNVDSRIPDVGKFKFVFPYVIKGDLSPTATAGHELMRFNVPGVVDKSKFITYGGYLTSDVSAAKPDSVFMATIKYPSWILFTKLPEHCGREHPVLRVLNEHIAHAITTRGASQVAMAKSEQLHDKPVGSAGNDVRAEAKTSNKSTTVGGPLIGGAIKTSAILKDLINIRSHGGNVYGLNDGITPLASALFLPDSALTTNVFKSPVDVEKLPPLVDVRKARVFGSIDHLTFIDGYTPRGHSPQIKDELSPGAPERTIFRWILTDLMDIPEGQIAADPKNAAKD